LPAVLRDAILYYTRCLCQSQWRLTSVTPDRSQIQAMQLFQRNER